MLGDAQRPGGQMGFGEAISTCFRKYATFSGRARRAEYWYFYLFAVIAGFAGGVVDGVISVSSHLSIQPVGGLISLVLLLPRLSVAVRRLHDVNYSGWFLGGFILALVALIAVVLGMVVMAADKRPDLSSPLGIAVMVSFLPLMGWGIWLFVLTVLKGTGGPNRYGEDPLAPSIDVFN
jgi:uncharacterized membrane protein YhaH (DUF805 family)